MNYLTFQKSLQRFPVFSISDIIKCFPNFDNRRLVEWQKKGYLLKVRRGYYRFADQKINEHIVFFTANKIYSPSYISFESALAYYNLIPESVFLTTSATTLNTANYETEIGNFSYRHLKTSLFFGYSLVKSNNITIRIAKPEKVLLDYFYINKVNTASEMEGLRFNQTQVNELVNFKKLEIYSKIFNSNVVNERVILFKHLMDA